MRLTVHKTKKDKKGAIKQGAASIPEEDVPEAGAEGILFPWWILHLTAGLCLLAISFLVWKREKT